MERFEYDPGKEDFPEVYIRDPRTGVQFELEDMDDLREGTVLSLNIERKLSPHVGIYFADNQHLIRSSSTLILLSGV
jgi:hypothetical protein